MSRSTESTYSTVPGLSEALTKLIEATNRACRAEAEAVQAMKAKNAALDDLSALLENGDRTMAIRSAYIRIGEMMTQ